MKPSVLPEQLPADFAAIADSRIYLQALSDIDRAKLYPYSAPGGGYVLVGGALYNLDQAQICLLYTSPSPRDRTRSRMPSSA